MKITYKALVAGSLMSLSAAAFALPVSGGISFSSQPDHNFSYDTDDSSLTFGLQDDGDGKLYGTGEVDEVLGDYANYFNAGDTASFYNFIYNPLDESSLVWSGTGTSVDSKPMEFYLQNLHTVFEGSTTLVLEGTGYLVDVDSGEQLSSSFNLTANSGGGTFGWSSSTSVPEPGTLALLGLGLAGLGAARRRNKAA